MIVVRNFLAFLILIQKNLNGLKKKIWLGQIWAQRTKRGPQDPTRRVWALQKNNNNNRVGSGSQVLARGSGLGM